MRAQASTVIITERDIAVVTTRMVTADITATKKRAKAVATAEAAKKKAAVAAEVMMKVAAVAVAAHAVDVTSSLISRDQTLAKKFELTTRELSMMELSLILPMTAVNHWNLSAVPA